ncbi:MAG: YciI family protein [Gammaproteobacteria bacterium]
MPFIAICHDQDSADSAALRETHLRAHFDYIEGILDRLLVAGPAGGKTNDGKANDEWAFSVFIYATDDRDDAERLLHADPYYRCGLYGEVTIEPFVPAAGAWIGGKVW